MIDTPMVLTDEDLREMALPVIGTEPLEYLGETDTHAFHFMSSTDGLGHPNHYAVFATSLDNGEQ